MPRLFRIFRGADNGRSALTDTDRELQLGPVPERVDRQVMVGNRGKIGPNVSGFPPTGGLEFLGHVPTVHVVDGVVPSPTTAIDDTVGVPAIFAGNPLP